MEMATFQTVQHEMRQQMHNAERAVAETRKQHIYRIEWMKHQLDEALEKMLQQAQQQQQQVKQRYKWEVARKRDNDSDRIRIENQMMQKIEG